MTRHQFREATREALAGPGGSYSLVATLNSVRFQAAVMQRLIERALVERPTGGSLFIPHDILWSEFLVAAGLTESEGDRAPIGRRLAFEHHQSMDLTYGPTDEFISKVKRGAAPLIAANVRLSWPDRPDRVRKFSFDDTGSIPRLRSTNHQRLTFRFLVFSDMTALEEVDGISGRPLSGVLGALFKVLGDGNVDYARFGLSEDGRQVLRSKATKVVSKTVTATINPDGTGQSGVPEGRGDLSAIEARLKEPFEAEYFPYRCWSEPR